MKTLPQYIYTALKASTGNDCSLALNVPKPEQKRLFGHFIEGKRYICYKAGANIICAGFFHVVIEKEVPQRKKISRWETKKLPGMAYAQFEFTKEIATKYLKHTITLQTKQNQKSL
jgi:hypothetical protein